MLNDPDLPSLAIIAMGVCGSGKTTVGEAVAARLGVPFHDADVFHPAENVRKMSSGQPLDDDDRVPWLDAIGAAIKAAPAGQPFVASCSALKRAYRDRIRVAAGRPVTFLYLSGPPALLAERMAGRKGHFMPPSLLESQLATLEPPAPEEGAITVSIDQPVDAIVDGVLKRLGAPPADIEQAGQAGGTMRSGSALSDFLFPSGRTN